VAERAGWAAKRGGRGQRAQVYLDAESLAIAARLGGANISEGLRKALKQADER
jgi:hypothetical protein